MTYANHFSARRKDVAVATAQTAPIPGREREMVRNGAGGMVFAVGTFDRLRRFLILGADAPTFHVGERELVLDNVEGVLAALREDGLRAVREIVEVSAGKRAPKNDHALYALALAASYGARGKSGVEAVGSLADRIVRSGDPRAGDVRRAAFDALPQVARTGTHVMQFAGFLQSLRGWGQGPMKAVARWLAAMSDEKLSLQAVKYRQREGWTMRDLLRLAHPRGIEGDRRFLIDWIAHRALTAEEIAAHDERVAAAALPRVGKARLTVAPRATERRHAVRPGDEVVADARERFRLIDGYHLAQEATSAKEAARIVRSHGIPMECVPSAFMKDPAVWEALLEDMGAVALVRNLNRMTVSGVVRHGSEGARFVAERLTDEEFLRNGGVHPFKLLLAMKVYQQGKGHMGDLTWSPVSAVVDALDAGFYAAFRTVRPSGKRYLLGLDVSGSMKQNFLFTGRRKARDGRTWEDVRAPINAREASAAMAMATMASEPECFVGGFTMGRDMGNGRGFTPLDVSPRRRLDDVVAAVSGLPFGGTDASLPIAYATERGLAVDVFVVYTDNETWGGKEHVTQALRRYRDRTGIPAKLVACGMTATRFSVVDPEDPLQMNVVGFDGDAPAFISDFARG